MKNLSGPVSEELPNQMTQITDVRCRLTYPFQSCVVTVVKVGS